MVMFTLSADASILTTFFGTVGRMVRDAEFVIGDGKIETRVMDDAGAGMVACRLDLKPDALEITEPGSIGIDVQEMRNILKSCKSGPVAITCDGQRMRVSGGRLTLKTTIVDPRVARHKYLPISPKYSSEVATFNIPVATLAEILAAFKPHAEKVVFVSLSHGSITLIAGDEGSVQVDYHLNGGVDIDVETFPEDPTRVNTMISLDYLDDIVNGVKFADSAVMEIGHNVPLHVKSIPGGSAPGVSAEYFIAPRIVNE